MVGVIVREDKVLAMRRAASKDAGPGLWETLSGRVDLGEDPLDTVKREIQEECGLEVRVHPRPVTSYYAERNGEPMIVIVYRADYHAGEVVLSEEHDDYAWLSLAAFSQRSELTKLVEAVALTVAD